MRERRIRELELDVTAARFARASLDYSCTYCLRSTADDATADEETVIEE